MKPDLNKIYSRLKFAYFVQLFFLFAPFLIEFSPLGGVLKESMYFPYTFFLHLLFALAFLYYFGVFAKQLGENVFSWVLFTAIIYQLGFLLSMLRARSLVKERMV